MSNQYGPWVTMIDVGNNLQLSTFWRRRLTMLTPASQTSPVLSRRNLFWLGAAAVLMLLPPTLYAAPTAADEEKPGVLVYQVDPKSPPATVTAADMERLLKVIDQRLNAGPEKLAKAKKLDDRRIEVALLRPTDADRQRVERLMARRGTLEFRILANSRDDKAIIERAQKDEAKNEVLDAAGKKVAWWVPAKSAKEIQGWANSADLAVRTKKKDRREVTEILVVSDPQNVTGDYLARAESGVDRQGRPNLQFTFNKKGGELFGKLTGEHLPDQLTGFSYKLGIILDGELYSAPSIHSTIYEHGEITGSLTKEEVSDLANTLNAGSLPVRIRLVEKQPHNK